MKQKIFMVRHGKPDFPDAESYIYGHTDYALSKRGHEQAARTGRALSAVQMDYIASSDLARAVETANIICSMQIRKLCTPEIRSDLREINMGAWDGVAKDEILQAAGDLFELRGKNLSTIAPPGGETFVELQVRAMTAFKEILAANKSARNIMLVAHGGFFWTIMCALFELPLDDIFAFGFDYAALHFVEYRQADEFDAKNFRLVRYNWSPDLMDSLEGLL